MLFFLVETEEMLLAMRELQMNTINKDDDSNTDAHIDTRNRQQKLKQVNYLSKKIVHNLQIK